MMIHRCIISYMIVQKFVLHILIYNVVWHQIYCPSASAAWRPCWRLYNSYQRSSLRRFKVSVCRLLISLALQFLSPCFYFSHSYLSCLPSPVAVVLLSVASSFFYLAKSCKTLASSEKTWLFPVQSGKKAKLPAYNMLFNIWYNAFYIRETNLCSFLDSYSTLCSWFRQGKV